MQFVKVGCHISFFGINGVGMSLLQMCALHLPIRDVDGRIAYFLLRIRMPIFLLVGWD